MFTMVAHIKKYYSATKKESGKLECTDVEISSNRLQSAKARN